MKKLKMAWIWIRDHAGLLGFIIGASLSSAVFLLLRRRESSENQRMLDEVRNRSAALAASRKATDEAMRTSKEEAIASIKTMHDKTIKEFDDAQKSKLDAMGDDPAALAAWLTSLSRGAGPK